MKEIVRLQGLPHDIITDRGTIFTWDLWKRTTGKLRIEWRLSTAFQPQRDGQTERTNAILEQYLRAYINYQQDDWCGFLPLAEFAYNNGYQETIKNTPFFTNYGINPEYEMIGHVIQVMQTKPEEMTRLHESLRNEIVATQLRKSTTIYTWNPILTYNQGIRCGCCQATSKPRKRPRNWTTRKSDYSKSWQRLGQTHISWPYHAQWP